MNKEPLLASAPAATAVDHLLLGVSNLEQGIAWVEKLTGVKAIVGGKHPGAGTQNALLSLGRRQYLEIIAPDPDQPGAPIRFGDLRSLTSPRLITWAAAAKDISVVAKAAQTGGLETIGPLDGARARPDGRRLNWKTLQVKNELGGLIPFFIEWGTGVVHPSEDSPAGCQLQALEMEHPEPEKVKALLAKLGLEAVIKRGRETRLKAKLDTPKGKVELI